MKLIVRESSLLSIENIGLKDLSHLPDGSLPNSAKVGRMWGVDFPYLSLFLPVVPNLCS